MQFRNPTNGHVVEKSVPALWCFLFGAFYFLASGIWVHALIMIVVATMLFAALGPPATLLVIIMDVLYCAFAASIVENYYLHKGWQKIDGVATQSELAPKTDARTCPYCAEEIKFEAIKCKHCGSDLEMQKPLEPPSEQELAAKYGITFDGNRYTYKTYKYDNLSYAIDYAKRDEALQRLDP